MRAWVVGLVLLVAGTVHAQAIDLLESAAFIGSGVVFSLGEHELNHELMALALHEPIKWNFVDATWQAEGQHIVPIAMAGFIGQSLSVKGLQLVLPDDHPFGLGFRAFYAVDALQYAIRSAVTPGGYGDFTNLSHSDRTIAEGVLLADAVFELYRLFRPNDIPKFIKTTGSQVGVTFNW